MENKKAFKAVALKYESEFDQAPRMVAKGKGKIAERMLETATEHGVPIRQSKALVDALSLVDRGDEIPENLYVAVAQILAEVLYIDATNKKS